MVAEPIWGRIATFSISSNGLSAFIGSGLVTSRPAPQIDLVVNASKRSCSLCTGPLVVLIKMEDGFILLKASQLNIPLVSGFKEQWQDTTSLCSNNSSKLTFFAFNNFSASSFDPLLV